MISFEQKVVNLPQNLFLSSINKINKLKGKEFLS